jgi:hypothetical protein
MVASTEGVSGLDTALQHLEPDEHAARSLMALRDLIVSTMSDIPAHGHSSASRTDLPQSRSATASRWPPGSTLTTVASNSPAHPVAPEPVLDVDRQLLGSAVMNLLNNAFKFTRVGGQVALERFSTATVSDRGRRRVRGIPGPPGESVSALYGMSRLRSLGPRPGSLDRPESCRGHGGVTLGTPPLLRRLLPSSSGVRIWQVINLRQSSVRSTPRLSA